MDLYAWTMIAVVTLPALLATFGMLMLWRRTHAVEPYVPADATPPGPYAAAMIERATREHGFRWAGAAHDADHPTLRVVLLARDDDATIALVHDGKRRREPVAHTTLETRLADGRTIVTSDLPMVVLDPLVEVQTLINADFGELRRLHDARLATASAQPVPGAVGWPQLNEHARLSLSRLIDRGRVRLTRSGDRYRHTLRAALRLTIGEFLRELWNPPDARRLYKRRPGSDAPPPASAVAAEADGRPGPS